MVHVAPADALHVAAFTALAVPAGSVVVVVMTDVSFALAALSF